MAVGQPMGEHRYATLAAATHVIGLSANRTPTICTHDCGNGKHRVYLDAEDRDRDQDGSRAIATIGEV